MIKPNVKDQKLDLGKIRKCSVDTREALKHGKFLQKETENARTQLPGEG